MEFYSYFYVLIFLEFSYNGNYTAQVPADFADGDLTVKAETEDRNGKPVDDEDSLLKTDHDKDPTTPDQGGLDRSEGDITVKVDNKGNITGGTTDVEPDSDVKLTITGQDKDGKLLEKEVTVKVYANGNYTAQVPADFADGDLTVKAETEDRNGKPVDDEDKLGTGKTDDPTTPGDESEGLDRVDGELKITEINEDGVVKGQTTDVPVGSDVVLTFKDHTGSQINDPVTGKPVTVTTVVKPDGSYEVQLPEDLTSLTDQINVKADSFDNNGKPVSDNEDTKKPITEVTTNGNDSLIGTTGDDVLAGDTGGLKTNFEAGHNYNVSLVLDLSGSMKQNLHNNQNAIPPALSRLDIAKSGLKAFIQQMVEHDGVINLQLASFSSSGIDPDTGKQYIGNTYNKSWVVSKDNLQEIFNYIDGLKAAGGTNPNVGWDKASKWFDGAETGLAEGSVKADSSYENQTYFLTDGKPNTYNGTGQNPTNSDMAKYDADFAKLANKGKVFAVGVSNATGVQEAVSRYDNTDVNGNIIPNWSKDNHGSAQAIADADKLIAYLIGGSENFIPADVGNDVVKGGAGDDILFGDAMNTDWITGLDPLQYPKYSGYSKLIAHLKADVTDGAEPTQQEIYDFVKTNFQKFIDADTADAATKGGNDTIVYDVLNAADATGGNGTDTWVDYEANDKIEFGADFFEGLLADKSNISEYIKVEDVGGKAVLKVDRDGADANGGTTHDWADLLIIEGKTALELQDLINEQIYIG